MLSSESSRSSSDRANKVKPFSEVPGPNGLPVLGTLLQYMTGWDGICFAKMFEVYQKRAQQYGWIYKECIGPICNVVVTDYKEYSKVMKADGKTPHRMPLEPLLFYRLKRGLGEGLSNGNGDGWHTLRKASNKKMMRALEVASYLGMMDEVAKDMVALLAETRDSKSIAHNVNPVLFRWSLESACTFLMGTRLGTLDRSLTSESQAFVTHVEGFFECMHQLMCNPPVYKLVPTPTWKRFEHHCDKLFEHGMNIADRTLNEKHAPTAPKATTRESVLSYLFSNTALGKVERNDLIGEFMMGSVESVSSTLLWCMYLLARNAQAQQVLYEEVCEVVQDSPSITIDHITNLRYVKACIRETMRLYPAVFTMSRILKSDLVLCGYLIPAGSHVQANTYTLCHDPKIFPEPDSFIPERWLEESDHLTRDLNITNLIWGHGARMCIGRKIAEQEMYLGLARLIQRFHLFYNEREDPKPVLHTVMTIDRPLNIKLADRSKM